jgi:hypothetical protein
MTHRLCPAPQISIHSPSNMGRAHREVNKDGCCCGDVVIHIQKAAAMFSTRAAEGLRNGPMAKRVCCPGADTCDIQSLLWCALLQRSL